MDPATFIESMVERFQELAPLLAEHKDDNFGEVLPHVFMGDVTRFVEQLSIGNSTASARQVTDILGFLEEAFLTGGEDVQGLIAVSFLENLPRDTDAAGRLRRDLGPQLAAELRRLEDWTPGKAV